MSFLDQILKAVSGGLEGALQAIKEDSEPGRRGSDRIVTVGRRRLDQFKYGLIQLKPTEEVCEELVEFLVDYLGTHHIGIYLWNEAEGTFSLQKEMAGVRQGWRVFEPFLMYMADHDDMILRDRPVSGLHPDVALQRDTFFKQTRCDLIVPLVLNESLLGILFIGPPGAIDWTAARLNGISEVRSLVTMALSNSILYARLQGILGHLEEKVRERTRRLEETQAHLVQSEKMAMLGVMIAGIAHEINTPAGVIFGGSMNLEQNLEGVLNHIPWLLDRLGEERLKELMHISLQQARQKIHVSGAFKKKKELQKELEKRWPDHDVSKLVGHLVETGLYAEPGDLNSEGVTSLLDTYSELMFVSQSATGSESRIRSVAADGSDQAEAATNLHEPGEAGEEDALSEVSDRKAETRATERLVDFLKLISSTGKNLSNIRGSIDSIVRIVRALKSYSHPGQKTYGAARVEEGLSNTMIILSSVWKGQVTVEKDFQDTPEVECDADELNQVWTNLLTNSWQAMRGRSDASLFVASRFEEDSSVLLENLKKGEQGWLQIPAGADSSSHPADTNTSEAITCAVVGEVRGPAVCITVKDNGPGIPAEHIEKIWDPFFTTKDQGEGSGLGLSIVRRIVEEHGGAIAVRTAPDVGTHFCVLLPLKQDEETIKKKEARNRDLAELKKTERGQSMPFKFR